MSIPGLPKLGTPPAPPPLRKIALEEHFGHPIVFMRDSEGRFETRKEAAVGHLGPEYFEVVQQRLLDFDTTRLQAMDEAVDSEFFANTRIKSDFICSIGYGSNENLFPRNPRLNSNKRSRSDTEQVVTANSPVVKHEIPERVGDSRQWLGLRCHYCRTQITQSSNTNKELYS